MYIKKLSQSICCLPQKLPHVGSPPTLKLEAQRKTSPIYPYLPAISEYFLYFRTQSVPPLRDFCSAPQDLQSLAKAWHRSSCDWPVAHHFPCGKTRQNNGHISCREMCPCGFSSECQWNCNNWTRLDVHQTIHIKGDQTHGYWQWIGGFFTPWSEPLNNTFAGLKMSFQTTQ